MSVRSTLLLRAVLFVAVAAISLVFFIDLCDLVYDCGCRSLWNGMAQACNVHDPQTPDCPWCAMGIWGLVVPAGSILLAQALALFLPGRLRTAWRLLLAAVLFPGVGGLVGLLFGLATGYWTA